jgi:uncharacterized protein YjbI with pentapeptide repeats
MAPRELADLPYAAALRPHTGGLAPDGNYDTARFSDVAFDEPSAANARFLECAFTQVSFQGGQLKRGRFTDVWLRDVRLTGVDLAETEWLDATVIAAAAAGISAIGARLRRVAFHGCKLDSVNFRGAMLTEVAFDDCLLRHVDFGGAKLTRTAFPRSRLSRCEFTGARLDRVDLRGAELGITIGPDSLRGAIISAAQLMDIAPLLAENLGITVDPAGDS